MRDIKFRGLRTHGKGWAYGMPTYDKDCKYIDKIEEAQSSGGICTLVLPESVGQFTGLKDKNGVDIYEGDIIQFTYWWFDGGERDSILTGTIEYNDHLMSFQLKGVKNKEWEEHTGYENDHDYLTPFSELNFVDADFGVIGNIYENPELLEA